MSFDGSKQPDKLRRWRRHRWRQNSSSVDELRWSDVGFKSCRLIESMTNYKFFCSLFNWTEAWRNSDQWLMVSICKNLEIFIKKLQAAKDCWGFEFQNDNFWSFKTITFEASKVQITGLLVTIWWRKATFCQDSAGMRDHLGTPHFTGIVLFIMLLKGELTVSFLCQSLLGRLQELSLHVDI